MMISNLLKQTAVYWGNPSQEGFGNFSYDDPTEISCRWENRMEVIEDGEGKQTVSNAVVYTSVSLDYLGQLYLGDLDDMDSGSMPDDSDLYGSTKRIIKTEEVPSVRADESLYKIFLK